jgi:hypothetical protein
MSGKHLIDLLSEMNSDQLTEHIAEVGGHREVGLLEELFNYSLRQMTRRNRDRYGFDAANGIPYNLALSSHPKRFMFITIPSCFRSPGVTSDH